MSNQSDAACRHHLLSRTVRAGTSPKFFTIQLDTVVVLLSIPMREQIPQSKLGFLARK
jgi:hypothetical protein